MSKEPEKAVKDLKDASSEVEHRTKATIEHVSRDVDGDEMTTGEKVKSFLHEDAENTKADVDRAKRKIRDAT
ncbi:MAG: hypothetical protein JOZ91_10865 [Candidatus Eremiobacteraeota bacterium]|nr:hypothetical protein [Candidatus Eremiobacteraeota bacterium]MBV8263807.1 hypothetical protein [Candidatus Eremiobacteraeota bacterium]MBV8459382.1 hypothetical protein [Candidatus Eremiobacteraeota bacterium]MBV8596090.1 hypothetical protein [Candidatus Eremiobacteraeota bacterium]MBV8669881.1 hypothetical protein [Candidatus Eremiobacteraeota bacterium]